VRGWRFAEEVARELQRSVEDDLRGLAEDRLLDRAGLDDASRRRGHHLYRINDAGARALAERRGSEPMPVPRAGPPAADDHDALYLTAHTWLVLDALVRRRLSGLGVCRNGETGWMTGAEVHASGGFVVTDVDLAWLARLGLVERKAARTPGGTGAVSVYRVTDAGTALRVARTAPLPEAGIVYVETRRDRAAEVPSDHPHAGG
jgi:hypothetical protein